MSLFHLHFRKIFSLDINFQVDCLFQCALNTLHYFLLLHCFCQEIRCQIVPLNLICMSSVCVCVCVYVCVCLKIVSISTFKQFDHDIVLVMFLVLGVH